MTPATITKHPSSVKVDRVRRLAWSCHRIAEVVEFLIDRLDPGRVVVVGAAMKRPFMSRAKRERIFERDRHWCHDCGAGPSDGAVLVIDHIIPVAAGGPNDDWNLRTLCEPCNRRKGASPGTMDITVVVDFEARTVVCEDGLGRPIQGSIRVMTDGRVEVGTFDIYMTLRDVWERYELEKELYA